MGHSTLPPILILTLLGAALGYMLVPHYHRPSANAEARLRERALSYYQASRRFDFASMVQVYSPANQLHNKEKLGKQIAQRSSERSRMNPATLASQAKAAESIQATDIKIQIEGDWAVTSGRSAAPTQGEAPAAMVPLEPVVWVRNHGDWWIYQLLREELAAYGNPPDFARDLLKRQEQIPTIQSKADKAEAE